MLDLVKGRQNLKIDVSERTGQLKALVKENFDRFISCKNTIDDIHKRLRKSETHDSLSASGSSTSDMVIAIAKHTHTHFSLCNFTT
jgi:exocyst complex component 2